MYSNIDLAPSKYITVLLEGTSPDDIPEVLMPYGYTYYTWTEGSDGDEMLYRRITGQPLLKPPPLGPSVSYPS